MSGFVVLDRLLLLLETRLGVGELLHHCVQFLLSGLDGSGVVALRGGVCFSDALLELPHEILNQRHFAAIIDIDDFQRLFSLQRSDGLVVVFTKARERENRVNARRRCTVWKFSTYRNLALQN